jgi:hypothetical protein
MTFSIIIVRVFFGTAESPAGVKFIISICTRVTGPVIVMGIARRAAMALTGRIDRISFTA